MENEQLPPSTPAPRRKVLPLILAIVVLSIAGWGYSKFNYARHHEDTDDAQVDGNISPVICRVAGYVNDVRFEDNQSVEMGDTLLLIDDRDLRIKVQQSEAALENAEAGVLVARANVTTAEANQATARANVEAAQVRVWKAGQDYARYDALMRDKVGTRQQFDAVKAEKESAEAQLTAARRQAETAATQVEAARQQIAVASSMVAQRRADLEFARLQWSYAVVTAPAKGTVSRKNVQPGQFVNAGSALCSVVSGEGIYVVANFKETQLEKMQAGQSVEVRVDAFPKEHIQGTVQSFSAATGAKFSLLPPDNATGNFVKVVQRIPVKIRLEAGPEIMAHLRPGMSVKVSVRTS
jgi:membrane fusion protein (multidrug efflux system)